MKTPILCIVSKNINNLENLPRYLGLLKDPLTLFSSIYLIETLRDMASTSYIYKIDIGVLCYGSRYSVVSLKSMVDNRYQNGLVVISKAIEESHLLKEYPNVKTIVLK